MVESAALEILVGPAGCGKTRAALDEYRQVLAGSGLGPRRRGLWLAPTQAAANGIRDALAAELEGAQLDPGVRTFARFAGEVVWDAGLRVSVISPLERRRLLRRAIAEAAAAGKLAYFHRVVESPGLVNLVDEAISRLKRRDTSPDAFRQGSPRATPRRRDLVELYARYEALLNAGRLTDPEGLFLAARDGIRANRDVGTGIELVVVDGFTDFTAAQLEILRVISQRAHRVLVTLVGDGDDESLSRAELFAKTHATRQELKELRPKGEGEAPAEPNPGTRFSARREPRPPASQALVHLERNLFRDFSEIEPLSDGARRSLGDVKVIAASSVQAEIEEIARRVKTLLLAGARPEEIAVVFPSTREVAERVRGTFDDFGVPMHLDVRPRLAATGLVRSLLGVLRLHAEDWPYRRLLQVIGDQSLQMFSAPARPEKWPADAPSAASLAARTAAETCVRHAQLDRGREKLLDQIMAWAADDSGLGPVDAATATLADATLRQLAQHLDQLPASATLEGWIAAVEQLVAALGILSAPSSRPWQALTHGMWAIERVDAATGLDAADLRVGDFVEVLTLVASELSAPDDADATGRVPVLSAEAARFVRPRHLLVGGLSEQAFSSGRSAASEDLEEEDPTAFAQSNRSDEMLLFYQVVTRATQSLTLSYPALDAKAQSMPPSPLLVELQRCFAGELQEYRQPLAYQAKLEGAPLSRSDLRRQAVAAAQQRKRSLLAAMVRSPRYESLGNSLLDGIEAVASRGDRQRYGPYEGLFSSDAVRAILEGKYGADFHWSPSLLETYAACPFKFYSEQILRLAPMPELALESDPARRGSVLHDTLARLYGRLNAEAEAGAAKPTPESVAAQFQEMLNAIVRGRPGRGVDAALREIERRQIAAWASKFAQQHVEYAASWQHLDAPLAPRYFEARFGPKSRRSQAEHDATLSTDKPYELAVGQERLRFTGTIDRIDVGRVGDTVVFNVIDYKTSANVGLKPEQIESGTQIQLPLYAMAVAELLLADKQAAALSVGYWSVRGKGFSIGARTGGPLSIGEIRDGKVQMSAQWSELRESLLSRIAEVVSGIRRGQFPVYSEDKTCTQYCPYSTCCRIAHVRSLEKAWPSQETDSHPTLSP